MRFILLVCVWILSSLSFTMSQTQSICMNGGVNYTCPTVREEFNRWGVSFRSFYDWPTVFVDDYNPSTSLTASMQNLMPNVTEYLNGANVDKMLIPKSSPSVLLAYMNGTQPYRVHLLQPLLYNLSSPPRPTNPRVGVRSPQS